MAVAEKQDAEKAAAAAAAPPPGEEPKKTEEIKAQEEAKEEPEGGLPVSLSFPNSCDAIYGFCKHSFRLP